MKISDRDRVLELLIAINSLYGTLGRDLGWLYLKILSMNYMSIRFLVVGLLVLDNEN